jgi:peptidoglycan/xylan/chitin deacetylase (PgdA/CDA1 family)/sulfur carrier protein ThiS
LSYYVVKPPGPSRVAGTFFAAAAGTLLLLALLAGWAAARPFTVTVDGQTQLVRPGTTVADLHSKGALRAPAGSVVGVGGEVVVADGGTPPEVTHNGGPARPSQRLYSGDVVVSTRGADVLESVLVTDVPLPFETQYKGSGPLTQMRSLGAPGLKRVTFGALSGAEVTSTVLREPSPMVIVRSRPSGKVVALTFDDGPWPGQTDKVLDVLERENVRATFFMVGRLVDKNPKLARRVIEAGHDVGNHTYSHKSLARLSAAGLRKEIRTGRQAIEDVTGKSASWMRPPYGAMDSDAWQVVRDMDVRTALWDVDSRDWTRPGSKKIAKTVTREVRPGSVVLFHDGGGDRHQTVEALEPIIRKLKRQGYTFVTMEELRDINSETAKRKRATEAASDQRSEAPSDGEDPPG